MLTLLNAIPRWVWMALAAALSATSCKLKLDKDGLAIEIHKARTEIATQQALFDAERADAAQIFAETVREYRVKEQQLVAVADQARRDRDVQVAAARRSADVLRERLLVYTEAQPVAAGYSISAATSAARPFAPGSVGALLRDEAADVARRFIDEAERADTIRVALQACYAQYEETRALLGVIDPRP